MPVPKMVKNGQNSAFTFENGTALRTGHGNSGNSKLLSKLEKSELLAPYGASIHVYVPLIYSSIFAHVLQTHRYTELIELRIHPAANAAGILLGFLIKTIFGQFRNTHARTM
jgi:hypothetical protein